MYPQKCATKFFSCTVLVCNTIVGTNKFSNLATAGCLGLAMIGLAFLASRMGGLVQATGTLLSIIGGPTTGLFLLGTCVPFCGKRGALAGIAVSLVGN